MAVRVIPTLTGTDVFFLLSIRFTRLKPTDGDASDSYPGPGGRYRQRDVTYLRRDPTIRTQTITEYFRGLSIRDSAQSLRLRFSITGDLLTRIFVRIHTNIQRFRPMSR